MKSFKKTSASIYQPLKIIGMAVSCFLILSYNNGVNETIPPKVKKEANSAFKDLDETADEILAQEKAWAAALVAGDDPTVADLETVDSLMHRDFRLKGILGDQPPISKEMYLGMTGMSGTMAEVTSLKIVEQMGPIVVTRVTWTMDWARNGVKLPPYWDLIDTWIKREDGTWKILSRLSQPTDKPYDGNQNDD